MSRGVNPSRVASGGSGTPFFSRRNISRSASITAEPAWSTESKQVGDFAAKQRLRAERRARAAARGSSPSIAEVAGAEGAAPALAVGTTEDDGDDDGEDGGRAWADVIFSEWAAGMTVSAITRAPSPAPPAIQTGVRTGARIATTFERMIARGCISRATISAGSA